MVGRLEHVATLDRAQTLREAGLTLETQLATLIATHEITQTKARYCRLLDAEDFGAWRDLFTDDARFEIDGMQPCRDADSFVAAIVKAHTDSEIRSVHQCHPPEITVTAPDAASGIWPMSDYRDIVSQAGARRVLIGFGYYYETYRREHGQWRIASLKLTRIRVDSFAGESLPPFPDRPVSHGWS